ncbi:class I SAM-dependent methyltransferase [bacterium]|nr:class I SAM-dependent methyltransferase [bacterium]
MVWKAICEYLQQYIPTEATIADLGSGYGDFINQIEAHVKYAFDINPNIDKYLKKDIIRRIGDIAFSLQEIDFSFDVIFASNFFEHFLDEKLDLVVTHIFRCLKPNGKLILIQPNYFYAYREYWDDYTHYKAFSHKSLPDYLESRGFFICCVMKRFLPFSCQSIFPKSYWLTKLYLTLPLKPFGKQMLVVAKKES